MIQISFFDDVDDSLLEFAVILAKHNGKYIFCRHKDRKTLELPGGHRELGESILETGKRELKEETGAEDFNLKKICVYSVKGKTKVNKNDEDESFGVLYFSEVSSFGKIESEIEEIILSETLIDNWTYPLIQPYLIEEAERRGFK